MRWFAGEGPREPAQRIIRDQCPELYEKVPLTIHVLRGLLEFARARAGQEGVPVEELLAREESEFEWEYHPPDDRFMFSPLLLTHPRLKACHPTPRARPEPPSPPSSPSTLASASGCRPSLPIIPTPGVSTRSMSSTPPSGRDSRPTPASISSGPPTPVRCYRSSITGLSLKITGDHDSG